MKIVGIMSPTTTMILNTLISVVSSNPKEMHTNILDTMKISTIAAMDITIVMTGQIFPKKDTKTY